MKKKIFASIVLAGMMAVGVPTMASAEASVLIIEQESQRITVSVSGSVLLHIYNVTGVRVMSIKVDGYEKSYTLNLPKGCYIVKIGKTVRKITIR